jgi:AraC family transcriptional regulator
VLGLIRSHVVADLSISERRYEPDHRQPRHEHERASIYLFLDGGCTERHGERDHEYAAASIIVNPAGAAHAVRYGAAGGRLLQIVVGPIALEQVRADGGRMLDRIGEIRGGRADALMRGLRVELHDADPASSIAIEGLALELTAFLARGDRRAERSVPAWLPRLRALLDELDASAPPPSFAELATLVGVHPTHLARTFREHHGCTVGDYVRRARLREACKQLRATHLSIAEIAASTGFADQSHLGRFFKRALGISPAAYRRAIDAR